MPEQETVPSRPVSLQVRRVRVEVLEGSTPPGSAAPVAESVSVGTAPGNSLILVDPTVSRFHLEVSASEEGLLVVDHGSTNGTWAGALRLRNAIVPTGTTLRVGRSTLRVEDAEKARVELHAGDRLAGVLGASPPMRRLLSQLERAAASDVSVLIIGESGTGKELVARALHELSPRARKPLETVDCASLSPALVASELFGHERGAFTGADRQHAGAFERANGGTLFLDEVGELPAALQAALLGALERRRFRRVGGRQELSTDVRVVAATHRDLRSEVNASTFRLDLYYRLAVVTLQVPPLRERREDIPLLVEHFLKECGYDQPAASLLSEASLRQLAAHRWPGNVRELRNAIEATVTMGEAPSLGDEAGAGATPPSPAEGADPLLAMDYKSARARVLNEFEGRYLRSLLERVGGNVSRASREASLDRMHLTDLLRRHGLK